jgi:DHA2 family multidrug resistance protein-like MFS transporter
MFLDPKERTIAIGVWISSYSAGGVIGPLIGGVLLIHFWWGAVFLVAVPVMVLLLILGPILLPEFRNPEAGKLDFMSMLQSIVAVLAIIYGVKRWAESGFDWLWGAFILAGLAVGVIFVRRQQQLAVPLIDMKLFSSPGFSAALGTCAFSFFMAFGSFFLIAQYLQFVLGMSPLEAGLCTAPSGLAFIVGSMLTSRLTGLLGPSRLMTAGLLVAAMGFAMLMLAGVSGGAALVTVAFVMFSLGLAPVFTLSTDMIVGAAPPEQSGAAAAVSETNSEFAGALGIAILGSIVTSIYRGGIMESLPPGVPPEPAATASATVGGAIDAAAHLPGDLGAALLKAARAAYVDGFQATIGIGVVFLLIAAVVAATMLRGVRIGAESHA